MFDIFYSLIDDGVMFVVFFFLKPPISLYSHVCHNIKRDNNHGMNVYPFLAFPEVRFFSYVIGL